MAQSPNAILRASRKSLGNPYAYSDGDDGYDAVFPQGARDVHEERRVSGNPYAYVDEDGGYGGYARPEHGKDLVPAELSSETLLKGKRKGDRFSKREIEAIARNIQATLWKARQRIWPERRNITPYDVLDAAAALRVLGYRVDVSESLGQYSRGAELFEVAGIVDEDQRTVQVSRRFSNEIRNFTTAHELGHAVLHQAAGLHRDRAQDGTSGGSTRDETETEADIFAAVFLMPKKLVEAAFRERFLTSRFVVTEESAFALGVGDICTLEKSCRTNRDLSKLLAGTDQYNGEFFTPLAQTFGVSVEAMAIRLEELGVVGQ